MEWGKRRRLEGGGWVVKKGRTMRKCNAEISIPRSDGLRHHHHLVAHNDSNSNTNKTHIMFSVILDE
jgi:hypothetical protein